MDIVCKICGLPSRDMYVCVRCHAYVCGLHCSVDVDNDGGTCFDCEKEEAYES